MKALRWLTWAALLAARPALAEPPMFKLTTTRVEQAKEGHSFNADAQLTNVSARTQSVVCEPHLYSSLDCEHGSSSGGLTWVTHEEPLRRTLAPGQSFLYRTKLSVEKGSSGKATLTLHATCQLLAPDGASVGPEFKLETKSDLVVEPAALPTFTLSLLPVTAKAGATFEARAELMNMSDEPQWLSCGGEPIQYEITYAKGSGSGSAYLPPLPSTHRTAERDPHAVRLEPGESQLLAVTVPAEIAGLAHLKVTAICHSSSAEGQRTGLDFALEAKSDVDVAR